MELTKQRAYEICPSEVVAVARDDDDISQLWFADNNGPEMRYVTLSRSHSEASPYVERDDQKWSCYDGITSVNLDADKLIVLLDKPAAESLGGVESICVDCRGLNEETWERIERTVHAIFDGTPVPLTIL